MHAEKTIERLKKAIGALDAMRMPYGVAGGAATAWWLASKNLMADEPAGEGVDLVILHRDRASAKVVLMGLGLAYRTGACIDLFFDDPAMQTRDATKLTVAEAIGLRPGWLERRKKDEDVGCFILDLEDLVCFLLQRHRSMDVKDLRNLIEAKLIDDSWPKKLPSPLATRLTDLLAHPEADTNAGSTSDT